MVNTEYNRYGKPIKSVKSCGCYWDYTDSLAWHLCSDCLFKKRVEARLEREQGKPKCPGCDADARRQKCLFEQGGYCPRNEVRWRWKKQINEIVEPYIRNKDFVFLKFN